MPSPAPKKKKKPSPAKAVGTKAAPKKKVKAMPAAGRSAKGNGTAKKPTAGMDGAAKKQKPAAKPRGIGDKGGSGGIAPQILAPQDGDVVSQNFSISGVYSPDTGSITVDLNGPEVHSGSDPVSNQAWSVGFGVTTAGLYQATAFETMPDSDSVQFTVIPNPVIRFREPPIIIDDDGDDNWDPPPGGPTPLAAKAMRAPRKKKVKIEGTYIAGGAPIISAILTSHDGTVNQAARRIFITHGTRNWKAVFRPVDRDKYCFVRVTMLVGTSSARASQYVRVPT